MADILSQSENRAERTANIANTGNYIKCELCKSLELQLSEVLNKLSSAYLIVDQLSKERNCIQSKQTSDTTRSEQWNQVSFTYKHQKIPNHQKTLTHYG